VDKRWSDCSPNILNCTSLWATKLVQRGEMKDDDANELFVMDQIMEEEGENDNNR